MEIAKLFDQYAVKNGFENWGELIGKSYIERSGMHDILEHYMGVTKYIDNQYQKFNKSLSFAYVYDKVNTLTRQFYNAKYGISVDEVFLGKNHVKTERNEPYYQPETFSYEEIENADLEQLNAERLLKIRQDEVDKEIKENPEAFKMYEELKKRFEP